MIALVVVPDYASHWYPLSGALRAALDPSTASTDAIAARLTSLLDGDAAGRAAPLGAELRRAPDDRLAAGIVEDAVGTPS